MKKFRKSSSIVAQAVTLAVACMALAAAGTATAVGNPPDFSQAGGKNHNVEARVKPIIKIGQLEFRDLNGNGKLDTYEDWRKPIDKRVADLVSRMTLEEKAGMMQITSLGRTDADTINFVGNRHIQHLILRDGLAPQDNATRNNKWQEFAEGTRLGIPIVFASNPRDHVTDTLVYEQTEAAGQWPGTLGLAATNDLNLVRDFAEIARGQWVSQGIRKMYGYQVDVASEPRWNRVQTTFGEGPDLSAAITRQLVLGFQGQHLGPDSVAETIKHFPGHGPEWRGLDAHNTWGQWAAYPTAGSLFQYHLAPFQAAVDAGVSSIMSYYMNQDNSRDSFQLPRAWWQSDTQQFEEVAAAYNKTILTTLLRDTMGFKGYVNTDSGILSGEAYGVENLSLPERFAKAVKAGVSIFSDNNNPQGLLDAVQQGLLTEADLDPNVARLLTEMFELGLFEEPYTDPATAQMIANLPESIARSDEANRESIVLLRNDQNVLPVTGTKKVYVEVFAGANSATQTAKLQTLVATDPSLTVVNTAAEADVALVWLRPSVYQRPEHDYNDIALSTLTGVDVDKVQSIEATKPTVLVINLTNPWVINSVEPNAAAVVATFDVKADALLDVVRGRFNPSGKLPLTIPANQTAVDNNAPDVPGYAEAFDYAYRNHANDQYVFGFGLGYDNKHHK